ncbi:MAG: hypothetical protein JWN66_4944 [Sphingomonas bacterium]|uniref:DUF968 domain-containing protein n=1 Tax=Sphingomonas bacterium TaxID=1895847 RepID=UPI0026380E37|nr:putative HNHc nuclease [Sphingomonas bacterium]MDB5707828.1 hypothetical protein [Sphingomonas bacterium]
MARVDTRSRHRNAPRPAEKSAPGFLQWIRGRNCAVANDDCAGKIEAAHVDAGGDKGMGTKASDRFAVPLCSHHHGEQHRIGWLTFQDKYDFKALIAAAAFWWAWPGRVAWERKLSNG